MSNFWLWIRILVVCGGLLSGPILYNEMHAEFENQTPTWSFVAIIIGFSAVGLLFVLGIQTVNPRRAEYWTKPSWRANPFQLRQPAQFFHLGGWHFVAVGISVAMYTIAIGARNYMFVLPLSLGIGTVLGVKLAMFVFRPMFESSKDAA